LKENEYSHVSKARYYAANGDTNNTTQSLSFVPVRAKFPYLLFAVSLLNIVSFSIVERSYGYHDELAP
jgi:hypothetical protein